MCNIFFRCEFFNRDKKHGKLKYFENTSRLFLSHVENFYHMWNLYSSSFEWKKICIKYLYTENFLQMRFFLSTCVINIDNRVIWKISKKNNTCVKKITHAEKIFHMRDLQKLWRILQIPDIKKSHAFFFLHMWIFLSRYIIAIGRLEIYEVIKY